jgi:hypothetical protein
LKFIYYVFYRIFSTYDKDPKLSAFLALSILLGTYIIALFKTLYCFGLIESLPIFSKVYLYNKLYWYGPVLVFIGIFYLLFNSSKQRDVIQTFNKRFNVFSWYKIVILILVLLIPVFTLTYFNGCQNFN